MAAGNVYGSGMSVLVGVRMCNYGLCKFGLGAIIGLDLLCDLRMTCVEL